MHPLTITVANLKGGQGKTTSVAALGHLFARERERVVAFDLDPQANLTLHLLGRTETGQGLLEVLTGRRGLDEDLLLACPSVVGLRVVPSGPAISRAQDEARLLPAGGQTAIARRLRSLDADVVLIDTPPTAPHLLNVALAASDWVVVPVEPNGANVRGIASLTHQIAAMTEVNPRLRLLGIVPCRAQLRRSETREVLDHLRKTYGRYVFGALVREKVEVARSHGERLPPTLFRPSSGGAQDLVRVFHELQTRLSEAA